MKYLNSIFVISFIFTASLYGSAYHSNYLPFEVWAEMARLNIDYKEAIASFKKGNGVNFDTIFEDMESLSGRLPIAKEAREHYQLIIQNRRKEVEKLKTSRVTS